MSDLRKVRLSLDAIMDHVGEAMERLDEHGDASLDPAANGQRPWLDYLPWSITLAEVERAVVVRTLTRCSGNRTRAAKMLGVSIRGLRNTLQALEAEGAALPPPPSNRLAARRRQRKGDPSDD